jgi:hypothetical protein
VSRKKYKSWDDLLKPKQKKVKSEKPLLYGMEFRGKEVRRFEEFDGAFRRVTVFYEKGKPEILEWVGKIRVK